MFKNQWFNWKFMLITGFIVTGIAGVGYSGVTNLMENQGNNGDMAVMAEAINITVYRTPTCGCCHGWVDHVQQYNFTVTDLVKPEAEIQAIRQKYNLPEELRSCHTTEVNGYLVEGHVPVADIQKLVAKKPDIKGIAVPGMPIGTPGMEMGDRQESFDVLGFKQNGDIQVFNTYTF